MAQTGREAEPEDQREMKNEEGRSVFRTDISIYSMELDLEVITHSLEERGEDAKAMRLERSGLETEPEHLEAIYPSNFASVPVL